jgi:nucleoside-diphosphate-sugar epimerase
MGGAGYIFTGEHDAAIMHNSATINLNVLEACKNRNIKRVLYSSSACMYPEYNQRDPAAPVTREDSAYPAAPDSEYGWEKLFSERLYLAYNRNCGMHNRVARYHNIFGPEGTWRDGREKAPAALCRKVAEARDGGSIEVWGDGLQTRSFLYIDECIEGTIRLTRSAFEGPVNIGSEEMVSINDLAARIIEIAGKTLSVQHIPGPLGVRGRNSHNELIHKMLGWRPAMPLHKGLELLYPWIEAEVRKAAQSGFKPHVEGALTTKAA